MKDKKYLSKFFICLGTIACLYASNRELSANVCYKDYAPAIYAQLASFQNQMPNNKDKNLVNLESVEAVSGLEITSHDKITVHQSGTYFITANVQIGSLNIAPPGNVELWIVHNGTSVDGSRITQFIDSNLKSEKVNLNLSYLLPLHENDKISLGFSSSSSVGLIADDSDKNPVPSAAFSIFRIK